MVEPLLTPDGVSSLRAALVEADYCVDAVQTAIGDAGQAGLARNHTVPAARNLDGRTDALATLTRLFILQQAVPIQAARAALPYAALVEAGILLSTDAEVRASIDIRPYAADDGVEGWIVSDHAATLDTAAVKPTTDFVLGSSPASTALAQLTDRRPVASALDLGTGSGVQALHLARHSRRIVATDLNPRALRHARLTLDLSGVAADLRLGSLYDPVAGQVFDLITTNPPFVMSPPTGERLVYREGSFEADGLMRTVVVSGATHLNPEGTLHVLGNWLHVAGQPWQDRLASWIEPTGCDAVVIQREVLDPYEYVEIWLADAGLAGTPDYLPRYRAWLAYFDRHQVEGIGMGWVTLRNAGRTEPYVSIEEWPHAVQQPVGAAIAEQLAAVEPSRLSDERLLATPWVLAPDTIEETLGSPGAEDPSHIVHRRRTGLCRAIEVDTALGGVLGVCDGELALGDIIDAVARLLDLDPDEARAEVLPRFRELVANAWLTPSGEGGQGRTAQRVGAQSSGRVRASAE